MKQLKTRWADKLEKDHVLKEYPRPSLRRKSYVNLNGIWNYAFSDSRKRPDTFEGEILVPFSPEAVLSGVGRQLRPGEYLWYGRKLPDEVKKEQGKRWILHIGAADQCAAVMVNGRPAVRHVGGYIPFSADVTDLLGAAENELTVRIQDHSDRVFLARGKQKLERGGMFYTAQSGIWQTVWMEQVPDDHIYGIKITPRYDEGEVEVLVRSRRERGVVFTVCSGETQAAGAEGCTNRPVRIPLKEIHRWSPEDPFLYRLRIRMGEDEAESYFAMRKISAERDQRGIPRLFLNNRPYFQKGVLDQGYWPDGLYTAPSDEAMIFDIMEMKRLGFNMLRKHMKIEPERWYYHCDRLGMLVWQDMVCGGAPYRHWYVTYAATAMELFHIRPSDRYYRLLGRRDVKSRARFMQEMKETVRALYNHPSIVVWVIFNEGWGQFDANAVTEAARREDASRLLDSASGWFDQGGGDFWSIHNYFFPLKVRPEKRVAALTEFGGYCLKVKGHSMCPGMYGYRIYGSRKELGRGYASLMGREVAAQIDRGLSASVYTQLSDVEEEVNGIYTYDREVLKIDENIIKKCNEKLVIKE
ncbi:glycoside hydrolase family 2 protein [[Clostridium] hylemonae]|uniref:Glycosyl hydrolase family 2, sugar binding domain protein n=1 Tax=[Clostridium] hylemonae DSM 15053 TaxID=553973 RepID=C0C1H3_9FIRM|nr:glycoside hydrolase family 2 [[Clostridium] hylemonae]EEG73987.1 glycosyl hydrolase family 2, sugar binding domain protein [[Clostridium] hylemonae DSM 15053]QEK19376.1 Beta-galactosidase large subunit [[Clostridium] hylemonae DSM 15053]